MTKNNPGRAVNISVDVDLLPYYYNFHPDNLAKTENDPLANHALPKLLELFAELHIKATLFVIGETAAANKAFWQQAVQAGHELASHSHTHVLSFHLLTRQQKQDEIERSKKTIEDLTGAAVEGFRAPGYNIDAELLDVLVESGYKYDSSLYPGWFVPLSKLAVSLLNRNFKTFNTSSIHWTYRRVKNTPFVWELPAGRLLEIPLPTTSFKMPFYGTFHLNVPRVFYKSELSWLSRHSEVVTYELHPVEGADATVLQQEAWLRNVPGVGKQRHPWEHLRFRLSRLTQLGETVLLRDIKANDAYDIHPCT